MQRNDAGQPAGALGCLDGLSVRDGTAAAAGWLLHPDHPIDTVRLRIDGVVLGEAPVTARPDVAATFPAVAHAGCSAFRVQGAFAAAPADRLLHVETLGLAQGRTVATAEEYWPEGGVPPVPTPEAAMMERVSAGRDAAWFNRAGLGIAAQLLAAVRRHLPPATTPRLLDWGCGPARATRFMPLLWRGLQPVGCDIDAAAIAWCRANVPGGTFHATGPFPPLPFADGAFDAVVAASVMTHLAWPVQQRWLAEIRRVLAPGGVFVASVHGPLAALPLPPARRAELERRGLVDGTRDARLDGIAPDDYYRATYQTEAFTRRNWGRVLTPRLYRAGGLGNWQDLVVLQREAAPRRWFGRLLGRG